MATKKAKTTEEQDRQDFIEACRRASNDELIQLLKDIYEGETECRTLVGIGPDDYAPFFVNPLTGFLSSTIVRELDRREHFYVDQGASPLEQEYHA
jgi:hypothetical protein